MCTWECVEPPPSHDHMAIIHSRIRSDIDCSDRDQLSLARNGNQPTDVYIFTFLPHF